MASCQNPYGKGKAKDAEERDDKPSSVNAGNGGRFLEKAERTGEGIYLYCIIGTGEAVNFGDIGIGGRGDAVTTAGYEDISAVISKSNERKYSLSRENLLSHQRVIERVMKDYTVLPVRFSTIADNIEGIHEVLRKRYEEFKNLLRDMDNKIELGIKAVWKDMDAVFQEILQEDEEIKRLRDRTAVMPTYGDRINLGKMVQAGLKSKKETEADKMMSSLKTISVDTRDNQVYGDNMVLNAAFLVDMARIKEFDTMVQTIDADYRARMRLKYVGPVPPFNFVNIVVEWK